MRLPLASLAVASNLGLASARISSSTAGEKDRIEGEECSKTHPCPTRRPTSYPTKKPTNYPTPAPPPTASPTSSPTVCEIQCSFDYDCPQICHKKSFYDKFGTCMNQPAPTPPTPPPTSPPTTCPCKDPSKVPDKCEVDILIDLMELAVSAEHKLLAQWTRAAFHDAGTFDQNTNEGGANGCLLNHPQMRLQPENNFLNIPLNTLEAIKKSWHDHPDTCIDVSSADILQFAIFFATTRQTGVPGLTAGKRSELIANFMWGRKDELECNIAWTDNLPGFNTCPGCPIAQRCAAAGDEIEEKMINRNGFTEEEATALIGAHTIGQLRNTFGPIWNNPWVLNGADNATPDGPIFDNTYHHFLVTQINGATFTNNPNPPFDSIFPNWFGSSSGLSHLDTDVVLAFSPVTGATHPDYSVFSNNFASDNIHFLDTFFDALEKMGALGVTSPLSKVTPCEEPCGGSGGGISVDQVFSLVKDIGNATAYGEDAIRLIQKERKDEIKEFTTPVDREEL